MTVNYDIKADIIDIRSDNPKNQDVFFVDTNVWYWLTYSQASVTVRSSQVRDYPNYIKKIQSAGSRLVRCNLILAELAHLIEDTEYRFFCDAQGYDPEKFSRKEYRHNTPSTERDNVTYEIESVWQQVQQFSDTFPLSIDDSTANTFITDLKTHRLDGYDLFYLDAIRKNGVQILTDDGDFSTVPDITVFTANHTVIDAAKDCGKLIMR